MACKGPVSAKGTLFPGLWSGSCQVIAGAGTMI